MLILPLTALIGCSSEKREEEPSALIRRYDSLMALPPDTSTTTSTSVSYSTDELEDEGIEQEPTAEEVEAMLAEEDESTPQTPQSGYTIDQYLNDYERYLLTLTKSLKKMKSNDPGAMQEYTDALQQAQSMSSKLNGMQDQMKPHHIQRLQELNEKVASVAQGL